MIYGDCDAARGVKKVEVFVSMGVEVEVDVEVEYAVGVTVGLPECAVGLWLCCEIQVRILVANPNEDHEV